MPPDGGRTPRTRGSASDRSGVAHLVTPDFRLSMISLAPDQHCQSNGRPDDGRRSTSAASTGAVGRAGRRSAFEQASTQSEDLDQPRLLRGHHPVEGLAGEVRQPVFAWEDSSGSRISTGAPVALDRYCGHEARQSAAPSVRLETSDPRPRRSARLPQKVAGHAHLAAPLVRAPQLRGKRIPVRFIAAPAGSAAASRGG